MTHAELTHVPACAAPRRKIGLLRSLSLRLAARRQRRALAELDAERLADIGLSRDAALKEASRSFWDAPESWTS